MWTTWVSGALNASDASYAVYDGFSRLGAVAENQQLAPIDAQYGGVLWAKLGTFSVSKGRVTVSLIARGANGNVVADAVLVTPAAGPASSGLTPSHPAFVPGSRGTSMNSIVQVSSPPVSSTVLLVNPLSPAHQATSDEAAKTATTSGPKTPVQVIGVITTSPSRVLTTVNYLPDSAVASGFHQSTTGNSIRLSKRTPRRVSRGHEGVHESLVTRIAQERASSKRPGRSHHPGK
jgi:hypothetical protein